MSTSRCALLATIFAVFMCCAGTVQLAGINRIVVTDGRIDASAATVGGAVNIQFKSETFPLER